MAMLPHDLDVQKSWSLTTQSQGAIWICHFPLPYKTSTRDLGHLLCMLLHYLPTHALLGTDYMPNAVLGTGGIAARETLELLFPWREAGKKKWPERQQGVSTTDVWALAWRTGYAFLSTTPSHSVKAHNLSLCLKWGTFRKPGETLVHVKLKQE